MYDIFIINCDPDRRIRLEKHLSDMVHWSFKYSKDDPFIKWLKYTKAPNVTLENLSGYMNHIHVLNTCESDYFIVADDDVVFPRDWKERVSTLNLKPINIICMGVNYQLSYDSGYTYTGNPGGMECILVSKKFAKFICNNIDFKQNLDVVIGAMMYYNYIDIAVTPICHQTSILEPETSLLKSDENKFEKNWFDYIISYKPSGLEYTHLLEEFKQFMEIKKRVEDAYYERFGIRLDIWNIDYIMKQSFHVHE
jgi:hypothetical protein